MEKDLNRVLRGHLPHAAEAPEEAPIEGPRSSSVAAVRSTSPDKVPGVTLRTVFAKDETIDKEQSLSQADTCSALWFHLGVTSSHEEAPAQDPQEHHASARGILVAGCSTPSPAPPARRATTAATAAARHGLSATMDA